MKRAAWLLLPLSLVQSGCGEKSSEPELAFRADPAGAGPSLALTGVLPEPGRLDLAVSAREIDDVYGVAFRLAYDPSLLRYLSFESGTAFASTPDRVVLAREGRPGLLVAAVTRSGHAPGVGSDGESLAVVRFEVLTRESARIDLVQDRSVVLASSGAAITPRNSGGSVRP